VNIDITDLQTELTVPHEAMRRIVRTALKSRPGAYSLVFVDDDRMTEMNRTHLGREGTTDVLAFAFEEPASTADECAGEIVVSAERARDEARRREIDAQVELALYVAHGALHIAGLDDQTPEQAAEMRDREQQVLAELGYDIRGLWEPAEREQN